MKLFKKILLLATICLVTGCQNKESEFPAPEVIGKGKVVENSHSKPYPNYDETAFSKRIAVLPNNSTYQKKEIGTDIEEGIYCLSLVDEFGFASLKSPDTNSANIFQTDIVLEVHNGDLLEISGFELKKIDKPRANPYRITEGVYHIAGENENIEGFYEIHDKDQGTVVFQSSVMTSLNDTFTKKISEDKVKVYRDGYLLVKGNVYLTPIEMDQSQQSNISNEENLEEIRKDNEEKAPNLTEEMDKFQKELEEGESKQAAPPEPFDIKN